MFLDKTIFIYIYSNTNNFQMINFTQIKLIKTFDWFSQPNLIESKNRILYLKKYTNKKRKFHTSTYPLITNKKKKDYCCVFKSNFLNQIQFLLKKINLISFIYIFSFFFNYFEVFVMNIIITVEKIFDLLRFLLFLFVLIPFFSGKKFERQILNKFSILFVYSNLVMVTEKNILFSGAEKTWIVFNVINSIIINTSAWIGKNNIFSLYGSNENRFFWQFKTSLLSIFLMDVIIKLFYSKYLKFSFDETLDFPNFCLNSYLFLKEIILVHTLTDSWFFHTIGSSFMIITYLFFLYFFAFVKIHKNSQDLLVSTKNFILEIVFNSTKRNKIFRFPSLLISNFNYSDNLKSNIIEELLKSEKRDFKANPREKNSRWKIKKNAIKTPFSEALWNGELPILKQNLWYEIKSK